MLTAFFPFPQCFCKTSSRHDSRLESCHQGTIGFCITHILNNSVESMSWRKLLEKENASFPMICFTLSNTDCFITAIMSLSFKNALNMGKGERSLTSKDLTIFQMTFVNPFPTTNFRCFHTERVCRRQSQI